MFKAKTIVREILIHASLFAFIGMAFDCFIWQDQRTSEEYCLSGVIFGLLMFPITRWLERRNKQKATRLADTVCEQTGK